MDDCIVRLIDLPEAVGALVAVDDEGYNNIYVNARWGYNGQRRAYRHEVTHIANDDMNNAEDIRTVEARAGGELPKLVKARDLLPPSKPRSSRNVRRDMEMLRRLGVLRHPDPLLMISEYMDYEE